MELNKQFYVDTFFDLLIGVHAQKLSDTSQHAEAATHSGLKPTKIGLDQLEFLDTDLVIRRLQQAAEVSSRKPGQRSTLEIVEIPTSSCGSGGCGRGSCGSNQKKDSGSPEGSCCRAQKPSVVRITNLQDEEFEAKVPVPQKHKMTIVVLDGTWSTARVLNKRLTRLLKASTSSQKLFRNMIMFLL